MEQRIPESLEALLKEWLNESDRGCVLVSAAYLEDTLETLLRTHLSSDTNCVKKAVDPLFQTMGPLSSFSAKIKLVFALKLVNAGQFCDLEIVRKVRNNVAHSFDKATFSSQQIADYTSSLTSSDRAIRKMNTENISFYKSLDGMPIQKEKLRFTIAVAYLIGVLHSVTDEIARNSR